MQAFKTACLNYKSSDVIFRGKKLSRKNMILMKCELLDAEWKQILERKPYTDLYSKDIG